MIDYINFDFPCAITGKILNVEVRHEKDVILNIDYYNKETGDLESEAEIPRIHRHQIYNHATYLIDQKIIHDDEAHSERVSNDVEDMYKAILHEQIRGINAKDY